MHKFFYWVILCYTNSVIAANPSPKGSPDSLLRSKSMVSIPVEKRKKPSTPPPTPDDAELDDSEIVVSLIGKLQIDRRDVIKMTSLKKAAQSLSTSQLEHPSKLKNVSALEKTHEEDVTFDDLIGFDELKPIFKTIETGTKYLKDE